MNFVVLSSSRGTTFQAVLDRLADGSLTAHCLGLIADREDRGCVEKARAAGLPVIIVGKHKGEEREMFDRRIDAAIAQLNSASPTPHSPTPQLPIVAALGWMFLLSKWFVERYHHRIINVHPALLPKYPGGHAIEETLAAGDTETGMTIHLIDEGVDTGPTLLQKTCPILPSDTHETLKERIQMLEKEWYPKVLEMIQQGELKLPD